MSYVGLDAWKESAPELDDEPAQACPVCTGDQDADPCSESCEAVIMLATEQRTIAGKYAQARAALRLARIYRFEDGVTGRKSRRAAEVVHKVACLREDIRELRVSRRKEAA